MFVDPSSILKQFGIAEGMHVGDIGAGSGHYTLALAQLLRTGKVYAIDVQRDLLERLKSEARGRGYGNVEIVWANAEKPRGTKLVDHSLDACIISNVLFQIEDKDAFIQEIKRIIKPGGKILVVDWTDSFDGMGPKSTDVVTQGKAIELFTRYGFRKMGDVSAGAHHYGIILTS